MEVSLANRVIQHAYPADGVEELGRADSQSNLFFARELEHIIPQMFEIEYARISARSVFPVDSSAPPTTKIITYRQFDRVGAAKIISDYAQDIPLVEVFGQEFTSNVRTLALAAHWSVDEIADSAATGRPLDRMKTDTVREQLLRLENEIAYNGDANHGLVGLFSDTNIPQAVVATGVGGVTWALKTGVEMVDDLCACANAIPTNTQEVESPTRIIISPAQYRLAKCTQYNAGTDTSALDWFLQNHDIQDVMPVRELTGAAAGGTDCMIAYEPNISKIRMNVVMEIEQRAPQENDLVIKVIYRSKSGGVTVHKPLSLNICNGI